MAYWITHTIVAEKVCEKLLFLDKKGFCIGNIAPDCNIENEDWTAFEPPREITHYMIGGKKSMEGCENFFNDYIKGKNFASDEHYSFLFGYYSHLVTDVKWLEYMHDSDRIKVCYERINKIPALYEKIRDLPIEYYLIKNTFGKR
ncbi:MAG: zinc dependent phospholipase C family protein, partial [Oscillospiraceae bacterium]|nr:zinc dependent phospholipase C family protein [Oscillospiraceae bacterium]